MAVNGEKKLQRKIERIKISLSKREGISTALNPTRFIVIANYGLTTGATREELYSIFSNFGNMDDAKNAYDKTQGLDLYTENGTKMSLLLSFVNEVPKTDNYENVFNELPPGLVVYSDFITEDEEKKLLDCLKLDEDSSTNSAVLKHRRVKHFGYEFRYDSSTVDKENPLKEQIPDVCQPFLHKLLQRNLILLKPDQLTVNRYEPGQGIPPHIDTHSSFNDEIVSLSLGSSVVMNFTDSDSHKIAVYVPRRSVLIMKGPSRYSWTHGIVPRKTDVISLDNGGLTLHNRQTRTSFTFRSVRKESMCNCKYSAFCDSQQGNEKSNISANEIERRYVQETYDAIADHFNETRHKPWPRVVDFLQSLPSYSIVLDVGCGNGKYFNTNPDLLHFGCDQSGKLLEICQKKGNQVFASDIVNLSVRQNSTDACICIAVIHHLSTKERRLSAISNLIDSVRPGGKILIYVWAMEQDLAPKKSSYVKQQRDKNIQKQTIGGDVHRPDLPLPVHVNRTHFNDADILVPWALKNKENNSQGSNSNVVHRYYHLFQEQELEKLCLQIPSVQIVKSYYDNGNWCVILEKQD
uniref:Fe2OG dioxygenase domain-containing protein n=1 Tax=Strigamia maritima TaxID=126957 RepID=T1J3X4_STRMM